MGINMNYYFTGILSYINDFVSIFDVKFVTDSLRR